MILSAVIFLVLGFTPGSECLVCYQCADTRMDGPCQSNTADLVQSNKIWSNKTEEVRDDTDAYLEYVKSCPPEQQYCVIERIEDKDCERSQC
ncbi:uncharacterized protein LOC117345345 isoform X2 [Pecten maximus]|uniref:uncharacterized protein LOC117345345 isoform X2 n=1 Tax=Pecten maximus TaxID=6579 RepID=UPI001458A9A9|nr:uncharacterized protein LOC117345345 isoform X2 [Pecten maximus]